MAEKKKNARNLEHRQGVVHVSHEQVISVLVVVMLDDGRLQRERWEGAPITGRRGERQERPFRKDVGIPACCVLDLVLCAVIAEDAVANMRDVLTAISWECYRSL